MQALLALAAILQPMISTVGMEDWWLVSYGGDRPERMVVFVDKNSVQRTGNVVRAWEADYQETGDAGHGDGYSKAEFEFDCAARTFRTIAIVEQRGNGVAVSRPVGADLAVPTAVAANTLGETEMKFVCGHSVGATQIGGGLDVAKVGKAILAGLDGSMAQK